MEQYSREAEWAKKGEDQTCRQVLHCSTVTVNVSLQWRTGRVKILFYLQVYKSPGIEVYIQRSIKEDAFPAVRSIQLFHVVKQSSIHCLMRFYFDRLASSSFSYLAINSFL